MSEGRTNMASNPKPADRFKLAYGRYDEDRDSGTSNINNAVMMGGAGLGAAALHHMAMNNRSDLAGAYQRGVGGSIREGANSLRQGLGMKQVAMPPPLAIGKIQDALRSAGGTMSDIAPHLFAGAGAALTGAVAHNKAMAGTSPLDKFYQTTVGKPIDSAAGYAADKVNAGKNWVDGKLKARAEAQAAAEAAAAEAAKPPPPPPPVVGGPVGPEDTGPKVNVKRTGPAIDTSEPKPAPPAAPAAKPSFLGRAANAVRSAVSRKPKVASLIYQTAEDDAFSFYGL